MVPFAFAAEDTCTSADLREIKTYNVTARDKLKDYEKLMATASSVTSQRDAKEFTEDTQRLIKFFRSDKYKTMEKLYKKCDMVIPKPMAKQSFWIPEDKRIYYGAL
tara:strand:+ start:2406 stop:2723 length:318 start_codon:yes stop_codon:yes gene_type:complete